MSNDFLAPYAIIEEKSRGRLYHENFDDAKYRSTFGRDRDRLIGSAAFRRLQYKTQVFVNTHGDHYRTRLTHSLEVAQIARWIAGGLAVNKDLAEIVALAHDLGHPPFGHAGEDALHDEMKNFANKNFAHDFGQNFGQNFGFSHNAHTLKLITKIENRFIEFQGLNLSWEVLEGVVKHNGPIDTSNKKTDQYIIDYNKIHDLDLSRHSSIEAQIAAIADDITYNNHDIEDGLRAKILDIKQISDLPLIGRIYQQILQKYPEINRETLVSEAKKRLVLAMVVDVINNTKNNIVQNNIKSEEDVRNHHENLVSFSKQMENHHQILKEFLLKNLYRHEEISKMTKNAQKIIRDLFNFYVKNPQSLPDKNQAQENPKEKAIAICDYIAGMTDRFATKEWQKLIEK